MSVPPTLADLPEQAQALMVSEGEFRPTSTVRAPCCGRKVAADMVEDLRAIQDTTIQHRRKGRVDLTWACDGCRERLLRDPSNPWTRAKLMRAQGYSLDG